MQQQAQVRNVLQRFQDGYAARDLSQLDAFMDFFVGSSDAELIGIGASVRGRNEWFQGADQIREIIESDWQYTGPCPLIRSESVNRLEQQIPQILRKDLVENEDDRLARRDELGVDRALLPADQ